MVSTDIPASLEVETPIGGSSKCCRLSNVVLMRMLLFAVAVSAVVTMVTSKQTKTFSVPIPVSPFQTTITRSAQFDHSSSFIYFLVALSLAGLYSLVTSIFGYINLKSNYSSVKSVLHLIIYDLFLFGIIATATGAAFGDAYIGFKGNSHANWNKICDRYDVYCHHIAASLVLSLIASIILLVLILLSVFSLSRKIPRS